MIYLYGLHIAPYKPIGSASELSESSGSASCGTSKTVSDFACRGGVKVNERQVMGSEREGDAARRGLAQNAMKTGPRRPKWKPKHI